MINLARGKIFKLKDLLAGLKSGHVKGVCLDVFPYEPPLSCPEDYKQLYDELFALENVVLSPHIGGWTIESKKKISEIIIQKLTSVLKTA